MARPNTRHPAQTHIEPSPELQRLARTVVSDQAQVAQESTAGQVDLPYRAEMESRFGQSFADVRVQVDPHAASAVGARAYTMGRNIVFATATPDRDLVAHELTHVVQQREGRARDVQGDESEAQRVSQGGAADKGAEASSESAPQLRKDAILEPDHIKSAVAFNNSHWKDPHRSEILKLLRAEASADAFEEPDVVKIASVQQAAGVDGKGIDGKLGPGTMAILLRHGLHLSEQKVKPEQVKLVFYPGEFEDLRSGKKRVRRRALMPRAIARKSSARCTSTRRRGTARSTCRSTATSSIESRRAVVPFTMHDRGHTADPSKAGTYKLGQGKSVITKSWSTSQIAWGAPLREHGGNIEFKNPGENWRVAVRGDEPELGIEKKEFYEDEAQTMLSPTWRKNDFGETGFRVEGSPGLFVHTSPDTEEALKEECAAQGTDEQHVVHQEMQLGHSHGCLHVDPYDRNRWMRTGYLQKGVTIVIKKYEDTLDVSSPNRK